MVPDVRNSMGMSSKRVCFVCVRLGEEERERERETMDPPIRVQVSAKQIEKGMKMFPKLFIKGSL